MSFRPFCKFAERREHRKKMETTFAPTATSDLITTEVYNETSTVSNFLPNGLFWHPHWHPYEQMIKDIPDIVFYAFGIYIAIVGIFGVVGNFLVMWMFIR